MLEAMTEAKERIKILKKKIQKAFKGVSDVRVMLTEYNSKIIDMETGKATIDVGILDFLDAKVDSLIQAQKEITI